MVACTPNRIKREASLASKARPDGEKEPLIESNENTQKQSNFPLVKKAPSINKKTGEEKVVRKRKKKTLPEKCKAVVEENSSTIPKETYIDENTLSILSAEKERGSKSYQKSTEQNWCLGTAKSTNMKKDTLIKQSGDSHGIDHSKLRTAKSDLSKFHNTPVKCNTTKRRTGDGTDQDSSRASSSSNGGQEKTVRTVRRRRCVLAKNFTGSSAKPSDSDASTNVSCTPASHDKLKASTPSTSRKSSKWQYRSISAPRGDITREFDPINVSCKSRKKDEKSDSGSVERFLTEKITEKKKVGVSKVSRFRSVSTSRSIDASDTDPIFCVRQSMGTVPSGEVGCKPERKSGDRRKNKLSTPENQDFYPRISHILTIHQLREEAVCRGFERWQLPEQKHNLLCLLQDGSIYLKETNAWKEVERIKNIMVDEASNRNDPVLAKRSEGKSKNQEKDSCSTKFKLSDSHESKQVKVPQGEIRKKHRALRFAETEMNHVHHVHSYPNVHIHPLALTSTILMYRKPRSNVASCDECDSTWTQCLYTCEKCNFDICKGCFDYREMTALLREEQIRKQLETRDHEIQEALAREKGRKRLKQVKWDEQRQFKACILNPPLSSKSPNGCRMRGYTVWCSHGDIQDGIIEKDFAKQFDTTWPTKGDANQRARYLFYWKNCWGLKPDELAGSGYSTDEEEAEIDGLKSFWIDSQPDEGKSSFWVVSVLPDQAFVNLLGTSSISPSSDIIVDERSTCTIDT